MRLMKAAAALTLAMGFAAGAALADGRAPTPDETAAVSAALNKAGFTAWGKVELDDGKWEIDDAVGADGKRYDVDLSVTDYSIIKQKLDD